MLAVMVGGEEEKTVELSSPIDDVKQLPELDSRASGAKLWNSCYLTAAVVTRAAGRNHRPFHPSHPPSNHSALDGNIKSLP
jgi:hypothetical protein